MIENNNIGDIMLIRFATEKDLPAWYELASEILQESQRPSDKGSEPSFISYAKSRVSNYEALTAVDYMSGNNMGFILQKLTGSGLSFIHAGGTVVRKDLSSGERLRIDTGCIVGFEPSVHYDIQFVGGFKNVLFGGEGLFLATLDGPGTVYLQTLPLSRLAQRIVSATGLGSDRNRGESGMGGPLLRGFLGGD
jgi:hypothetical protein